MQEFNFDKLTDRRGTDSYKWDVAENELPMWVADMDFETAPCVREAIEERAAHGIFGYNVVPDAWYAAYQNWWETRHHLHIEKDWLIFCTGVVPALSSMVRKLTTVGENVLILTPVYNIFFNSIVNNGRNVVQCPLKYAPLPSGKEGEAAAGGASQEYEIDWTAFEQALSNPQTTLLIFCNPHNPVGRIWTREELAKVGELCKKYHVTVISDEIHCDITDPGKEYVPFASVSDICRDNSVTCIAPTKAFNIAGMQTAAVFAADPALRHKVWRRLNTDECAEPNSFACGVTIAAFTKGASWLDALRDYLFENKKTVQKFLAENLSEVHLVPSEATYLLWLDCSAFASDSVALAEFLRKETGLYVSDGAEYGKAGKPFLRLNVACPRERLKDGLERLKQGISRWRARATDDQK
ncbi:MAG: pyridoxal phosphate-dependent aminotransferase [Lachnospiraceae bacterium]|nr:pyridoxal phosphate-dependent aminotransferase [Lachnospiraceae bacterium]